MSIEMKIDFEDLEVMKQEIEKVVFAPFGSRKQLNYYKNILVYRGLKIEEDIILPFLNIAEDDIYNGNDIDIEETTSCGCSVERMNEISWHFDAQRSAYDGSISSYFEISFSVDNVTFCEYDDDKKDFFDEISQYFDPRYIGHWKRYTPCYRFYIDITIEKGSENSIKINCLFKYYVDKYNNDSCSPYVDYDEDEDDDDEDDDDDNFTFGGALSPE